MKFRFFQLLGFSASVIVSLNTSANCDISGKFSCPPSPLTQDGPMELQISSTQTLHGTVNTFSYPGTSHQPVDFIANDREWDPNSRYFCDDGQVTTSRGYSMGIENGDYVQRDPSGNEELRCPASY